MSVNGTADIHRWAADGWFVNAAKAPTRRIEYRWANEIFAGRDPIMWHRLVLPLLALTSISEETLRHTCAYAGRATVALFVPGELLQQRLKFKTAVAVYASASNP
eukprot:4294447-Prymnesium_polylepis.1